MSLAQQVDSTFNATQENQTARNIQLLIAFISKAQAKGAYSLKDSHTIYDAIMGIKNPDASQEERIKHVTVFINAVQGAMTKGIYTFKEVCDCVQTIRAFNGWTPDYLDDVKHMNNLSEAFNRMADQVPLETSVANLVQMVDAQNYIKHILDNIVPVDNK